MFVNNNFFLVRFLLSGVEKLGWKVMATIMSLYNQRNSVLEKETHRVMCPVSVISSIMSRLMDTS
jgi:hypothetical protein